MGINVFMRSPKINIYRSTRRGDSTFARCSGDEDLQKMIITSHWVKTVRLFIKFRTNVCDSVIFLIVFQKTCGKAMNILIPGRFRWRLQVLVSYRYMDRLTGQIHRQGLGTGVFTIFLNNILRNLCFAKLSKKKMESVFSQFFQIDLWEPLLS